MCFEDCAPVTYPNGGCTVLLQYDPSNKNRVLNCSLEPSDFGLMCIHGTCKPIHFLELTTLT
ncbi:MAG: hypothetical protein JWP45_1146 [Mucilaginibacter sp.]|nr:hypothetical protein [Mucilaginibacter sp.]